MNKRSLPFLIMALLLLAAGALLLNGRFSSQAQAQEPGGIIHPDVLAALQDSPEVQVIINLAGLALPPRDQFNDATYAEYQQQLVEAQDRVLAKLTPADFTLISRFTVTPGFAGRITESGVEKLRGHPDVQIVAIDSYVFVGPTQPPPIARGDANCDGTVNSSDAVWVLRYVAGFLAVLPCADGADVNRDGEIDAVDAAVILQIEAGLCCVWAWQ